MQSWYPQVWRVDIPGYKELISTGMKRSGNEGTMGKHEKTLRGGEEPPKKLPLVVLTAPQPLSTSSSPPTLQFKQKFGELWIDLITSVWTVYDSMPDLGEIRVYQRADFQSCSRVLKKVFWTLSYLYLWHTMWFHAKKLLKTLKFWKSLNSL